MSLQYARLFQLRAGISLMAESGSLTKDELANALQRRRSIEASDEPTEGADQIITQLHDAHILTETDEGYRLSTSTELSEEVENPALLYPGEEIPGAGDERTQADRILSNLMYEHPMLLCLSKYVFRNGPVKKFEIKQEHVDTNYLGDKMNSFTIDMGLNLLEDAEVIVESEDGYTGGRLPIRLFINVLREEYYELGGDVGGGVREPELFERLQTLYGVDRGAFDRHLSKLHGAGIVSEASYEELLLNPEKLEGANIHE